MQGTLILLSFIGAGMAVGLWQRRNTPVLRLADRLSMLAVYGLLFILGTSLGADAALLGALPVLGGQALCVACLCTAGSVICLMPLARYFTAPASGPRPKPASLPSPFMGCLRILGAFALGIAMALASYVPAWVSGSLAVTYALYLLVFFVGIGFGANLRAFRIVRDMHVKIIAVPVLIVAGSAFGSIAASLLLDGMSVRDALTVGAGLGYYSLSSVLIEASGNSPLASVALLANITREVIAILAAPFLARYCGGVSTVGAAGATAMDTTLPIIARFSGERIAIVAVFSGMVLTLLVPFLVTGLLSW